MPGDDAGRFSTLVAAAKDAGTVKISAGLRLATGEVVSEVTQTRPVDAAGMATGAVAVSGATLAVVNNSAVNPVAELPLLAAPPPAPVAAQVESPFTLSATLPTLIGPAGPSGAVGATGPQGPPGPPGPAGPAGAPGAQGAAGASVPGPTGAAGRDGAPGTAGPPGGQGATGPEGAKGADGVPGPTGPAGAAGFAGSAGAQAQRT